MSTTLPKTDRRSNHSAEVDAFAGNLLSECTGALKVVSIYLGHKLGYYKTMAANAPVTSTELSKLTQTHERYTREWLEQQAVAGILTVQDESCGPFDRRYHLPAAQREVLADENSLNYLAPLAQLYVGVLRPMPQLLDAYRNGGGVAFREYGPDMRQGNADINRPIFLQLLGNEWIPAMPEVHEKLSRADRSSRVADFGCGCGWSAIGIAKAYPHVIVDGYDMDPASIDEARNNAADYGVADRVNFHCVDVGKIDVEPAYDLVLCCETVHDMGDPVGALRSARQLLAKDGTVLIVDERVAEKFAADGDTVEQMMYGWSILHCLPAGMADGAEGCCGGTGTVMRPSTVRRYAQEAGFADVEVLPVENLFFRLYRLQA